MYAHNFAAHPLTVCTGDHRSAAVSYPCGSSPGLWRMEMHTRPSTYTAWVNVNEVEVQVGVNVGAKVNVRVNIIDSGASMGY